MLAWLARFQFVVLRMLASLASFARLMRHVSTLLMRTLASLAHVR